MSEERTRRDPGGGGGLSAAAFWGTFAAAWTAYGALFFTSALFEGATWGQALYAAASVTASTAALAALIALSRRRLYRSDRGLVRTMALVLALGIAYSVTAAGFTTLVFSDWEYLGEAFQELDPGVIFVFRLVNAFLLYTVLTGFLMWTVSLDRVQESRALAAHAAELRVRAELGALRAQFNPHFVFNTLHSLLLLVRSDPDAAERAIEDVAALIRYASVLQREEVDAVPLSAEVGVAERYLALEKLRLADRLTVEWNVSPEAGRCAVPPFSLQTLLENAIKHGLEPEVEGGSVRVSGQVEAGTLVLSVEDDGAGCERTSVDRAVGHGLDLVRRRLRALYGEDGSLTVDTGPGRGFEAEIRVPVSQPAPVESAPP